jgi:hypothetical protein
MRTPERCHLFHMPDYMRAIHTKVRSDENLGEMPSLSHAIGKEGGVKWSKNKEGYL